MAEPQAPSAAEYRQLSVERDRLVQANAALTERLRALEAQSGLAKMLDTQATRLAELAERLEARLAEVEDRGDEEAYPPGSDTRFEVLQKQLAHTEDLLREAEGRAAEAASRAAELAARLKQQQLTVDEALLRADKAEKLHASLEEAHALVRTENERLSLELATAKERQAEAMQRVLELDTRLSASAARAGGRGSGAAMSDVGLPVGDPPEPARAAAAAAAGTAVVYEVREEDTLSRIAVKVYGDGSAWRRIFDANRDLLDGPDDLSLGMRLIIP